LQQELSKFLKASVDAISLRALKPRGFDIREEALILRPARNLNGFRTFLNGQMISQNLLQWAKLSFTETNFGLWLRHGYWKIFGEASTHLADEILESLPGIEWKKIAGMKVLIEHAYHRVDIDFLWTIATTSALDLDQKIRAKFPDLDSQA
jgi:hypothetical protein